MKTAVASFRHSLELQPENTRARRDIELVRQWIKYHTDKWREYDRQKRRQETNLVAFLEFLIETQRALRESVKALTATAPADAFAEPKRMQEELQEEIPALKDKIKNELAPSPSSGGSNPQGNSRELEQGIALLEGWAGDAGDKMSSAARQLGNRQAEPATADQQSAIDELEKIWDAVIPFHPLLARDLADQTRITRSLAPESSADPKAGTDEPAGDSNPHGGNTKSASKAPSAAAAHPALSTEKEDLAPLTEIQQRTLRRTQLLKLKAEAELTRLEKSPPQGAGQGAESSSGKDEPPDAGAGKPKPVDPKLLKAGFQKAIELAPRAVEQMQQAVKSLNQKVPRAAYAPAEQARKILEEIQKAQPQRSRAGSKAEGREKEKRGPEKTGRKRSAEKRPTEKRSAERPAEKRPGEERSGTEKAGAAEQIRRAETGSKAASAGNLTRSYRRGAAQGPRAAAGKARARSQDEGPSLR